MLAAPGARALATSSAAHAVTLGRPDGGALTRDEALAHAAMMVAARPLPVQGDFENGFGDAPETCAETVRRAAAAAAARALSRDLVLTARTDGVMPGTHDEAEAIRRLTLFAMAGADCLCAAVLPDLAAVARVCEAVPGPVNVLVAGAMTALSRAECAAARAARLSFGSVLARATHRVILDAGREPFEAGTFSALGKSVGGDIVAALLLQKISP